jgi:hypothetical protein
MMSGLIVDGHDSISATSHKLVGVSDWGWYMLCLFMQCMYYALLKKKKEPWSIYTNIIYRKEWGMRTGVFFGFSCMFIDAIRKQLVHHALFSLES